MPNKKELEKAAKAASKATETAVSLSVIADTNLLLAELVKFLDKYPEAAEIHTESHSEYDDEGSYYIYVSVTVTDEDENEIKESRTATYFEPEEETGICAFGKEPVYELFGEWEGALTRDEIKDKAKKAGITV